MPFQFVLPDLGEGTTEGEIRKWVVKEGDQIEEHQTVLELETDKAVVEVPSPKKGKVLKLNKEEGGIVKVGEVLMTILEEGEKTEEKAVEVKPVEKERPKEEKPAKEERPRSVSVVGVLPEEEMAVLATPAIRAMAKELGVAIEGMKGSGPGGSITKDDVMAASKKEPKPEDQYGPSERIPLRGIRRTIAKNLIISQRTTAFVTGMDEADITDLWDLREREKRSLREKGVHLTFLPFFMKAVIHALAEHPMLNASVDEEREEIIVKKYYTIGVAVDTPDGLMVPVVKDAVKKTILELALEIQELSEKARERKIKLEEMKGNTFTITNYGHFGGTFATPIINYPDVAILGTGKISEKPWVRNGEIVIRKILPLSLTFDHRVTDGVDASKFLTKVIGYLEDPALLFIESA
ncbi:MAG TPA: dihydrolipoamide acetyltransferase family protein [Thermodesulfovibrionales bacterium]|nr:dihydrolipoamide acetyltransferase family protein [Thermodesulfovibrionales bacterium]